MKTTLTLLSTVVAAGSMSAPAAVLIAGWDNWTGTGAASAVNAPKSAANVAASFVSTTAQLAWNTGDERGAGDDGTWGTVALDNAPDTDVTASNPVNMELPNATSAGTLTFTITNNGSQDIVFDSFHADLYSFRFRAARTYELSVSAGDLTNAVFFTSAVDAIPTEGGVPSDHDSHLDVDHSMTGLADHTLAPGESADILVAFSGGDGGGQGGHDLWVDNVAFSGEIIPEPTSIALSALGLGFLVLRRKR